MPYTPNADDANAPLISADASTAALEFRTLKAKLNAQLANYLQDTSITPGLITLTETKIPAIAAYVNGLPIRFQAANASPGNVTVNLNAIGAVPLYNNFSAGLPNLAPGSVQIGQIVDAVYNSNLAGFLMTSTPASSIVHYGTFTPALNFSGLAVGITYGTRLGLYIKIGPLVYYHIEIVLTSKGSSAGSAIVSGLPFASLTGTQWYIAPMAASGITGYDGKPMYAGVQGNATDADLIVRDAVSITALLNTNFGNTSEFRIDGMYIPATLV